jgi:phage N-6-adenine-methyltransferase
MNVHFSSQRLDWKTPKAVYQVLDSEFHFDYDPCPPNPDINGLATKWGKSNFVNPPYGNQIAKWIEKGFIEHKENNSTVVFLIPSRTDTRWWHDFCMKADEIRFIKGRLKFDDQENSAPFPSCIVIFKSS